MSEWVFYFICMEWGVFCFNTLHQDYVLTKKIRILEPGFATEIIISFDKCSLKAYYVPCLVLGAPHITVIKINKKSCPLGALQSRRGRSPPLTKKKNFFLKKIHTSLISSNLSWVLSAAWFFYFFQPILPLHTAAFSDSSHSSQDLPPLQTHILPSFPLSAVFSCATL